MGDGLLPPNVDRNVASEPAARSSGRMVLPDHEARFSWKTDAEMGERLHLFRKAIRHHLAALYGKIEVKAASIRFYSRNWRKNLHSRRQKSYFILRQ
ncbi:MULTISPECIES: hypothetical protein [Rhizobium]|uniref:Uncharacterized protein n=1 Tax=Rhizobium miluonense TaxID=411945 RepID=A0A1C3UT19_9HYPH|nr:hypothetical protein [Rhizobium miluonense]SCB18477.1 hypothetical protein GA0061102_1005156 [Rhizobium miluonense]